MFVYRTLRDAILRCELEPGKRLVTDVLARRLSVSHIPVREALQLLQAEGLVENIAHTGASVAPISRDSIVETFTVLEGLESVATRTAAERMTAEHEAKLAAIVAEMDQVLRGGVHERWGDLNSTFHLAIAGMADMPMLSDMTERALDQWDRIRR
ncbi:MAG: GntR family transcriptional regulator, partial [Chloroflexota bacterium]